MGVRREGSFSETSVETQSYHESFQMDTLFQILLSIRYQLAELPFRIPDFVNCRVMPQWSRQSSNWKEFLMSGFQEIINKGQIHCYDEPRQHIKKQRHYFVNKGLSSQGYGFSNSHVWMWELEYKKSWMKKNWGFWTIMLEKTLENPLDCKEIQSVHPKGDQSWVFIGRTDFEAETPIFWPPDAKSWLICKDCECGKGWRQEEKETTEDEMVGWHHQLNRHEFG